MAPSWFQGYHTPMLERKGTWGAFLTPRHPGHPPASLLGADAPGECPRRPIVATTSPPLQGSSGVSFPPYLFPLTRLLSLPGISLSLACLRSGFPHETPAVRPGFF